MTQRDYIAIAKAIYDSRRTRNSQFGNGPLAEAERRVAGEIASRIADVLEADNPRFKRDAFMKACDTYGYKVA